MKDIIKLFKNNKENVLRLVYIIPILFSVIVSINHVIKWYEIANPDMWAVFLSIGVEVAALATVVAIIFSKPGWHIYSLFILVTLIQFIGNIFYSYQYIDVNGEQFTLWVEFFDTVFGERTIIWNRMLLATLTGASTPLISLLSLNLLVRVELRGDEGETKEILTQHKTNIVNEKEVLNKNDKKTDNKKVEIFNIKEPQKTNNNKKVVDENNVKVVEKNINNENSRIRIKK